MPSSSPDTNPERNRAADCPHHHHRRRPLPLVKAGQSWSWLHGGRRAARDVTTVTIVVTSTNVGRTTAEAATAEAEYHRSFRIRLEITQSMYTVYTHIAATRTFATYKYILYIHIFICCECACGSDMCVYCIHRLCDFKPYIII